MRETTIAFAGILQACELVRQVATSGNCSGQAAEASLGSIFNLTPDTTEAVYGGLGGVRMGLRVAVELFGGKAAQDNLQSLNYALAIGKIAVRVERDRARQQALGQELELIRPAWEDAESALDPSVVSQLGDTYQNHISSLDLRVSVSGRPEYLKQPEKVALVRALLMAGLRSAFLWRQVGGRQWRLIFQRRRMLAQAEALLAA